MNSERLKTIVSFVEPKESVIDIGTDHGYVPIMLAKMSICSRIMASDKSENALLSAKMNIREYGLLDVIELKVSDGFSNISSGYDVAILAGMGTNTIKKILSCDNLPNKIIVQSNHDIAELRRFMNSIGYKIKEEVAVFDERYYVVICYVVGQEVLTEEEILFGKSDNIDYYKFLFSKYMELSSKSGSKEYENYKILLKTIIEKKQG